MVDAELRDGSEMVEPAAKRLCSTVASVVRKVAVEGNIGEEERERDGGSKCMRMSEVAEIESPVVFTEFARSELTYNSEVEAVSLPTPPLYFWPNEMLL